MRRGPVVALLLLVCCGSLEARGRDDTGFVNVESMRRDVREMAFQDLLGEGSSPEEQQVPKKRMKNASGMSSRVEFRNNKGVHVDCNFKIFKMSG